MTEKHVSATRAQLRAALAAVIVGPAADADRLMGALDAYLDARLRSASARDQDLGATAGRSLRAATHDDCGLIFDWRNDPETCAASKTTDPIPRADHERWFATRLARPEPMLFIYEVDGEPVASVRIDDGTLSYMVAPEHRQKGYASAMLTEITKRFGPLVAEVKADNVASVKAAENAGHRVAFLAA